MKTSAKPNIHGRRWGRGGRPYLLMLKIVGAAMFLGGNVSLVTLALATEVPGTPAAWVAQADLIRRAHLCVIIPGVVLATGAGIALLASVWRALIRMRWLQVKIGLIAVSVPLFHYLMRSRAIRLQQAVTEPLDEVLAGRLRSQMLATSIAMLAMTLVIIWLGRIKPRLGQDYGRTFTTRRGA
jgi:hypothetical protein